MQAAIGVAQIKKFPGFVEVRKRNFQRLYAALKDLENALILPKATVHADPSWFGFCISTREGLDAGAITRAVESRGVQTRRLFAGNLIKHPCFDDMRARGEGYRVASSLDNTDKIMSNTFWIGVYPGMTDAKLDFMAAAIHDALQ